MLIMKGKRRVAYVSAGATALLAAGGFGLAGLFATEYEGLTGPAPLPVPVLDTDGYNARMLALAHVASTTEVFSTASTSVRVMSTTSPSRWPVPTVYPNAGALLPFNRILAYYGNFYSKGMGVLGEYPADEVLAKLASTTAEWAAADPTTPVIPAIQYIAVVAQARAGKDGLYILRMPDEEIEHAIELANQIHGIVILDVQVGKSTVEKEIPLLEKYLRQPRVHLAIDPEFSMKFGDAPGTVIGTFDAKDINFAASYLAGLVQQYHLPPKLLVIHRFTFPMVTHYVQIAPLPEVQIIMDMDGFGSKARKYNTYKQAVYGEPVQFTGIKLFYKNDNRAPADGILSPAEVLNMNPVPSYIQYQ